MKKHKILTQFSAVLMAIIMVFSLMSPMAFAGERPLGDNPRDQVNYYIEVNDQYSQGNVTGNLYGWGILGEGVKVVSHEQIITGEEAYPDRSFDIKLAADTPKEAVLYILCDVDNSGTAYPFPVINKNPGKNAQGKNNEWTAIRNKNTWDSGLNAGSFKLAVPLVEGEATLPLYVYKNIGDNKAAVHTFHFSIVPPDTAKDPDPKDVSSIAITTPPTKTTYFAGGRFDPAGMVVIATLKEGGDPLPIAGYTVSPAGALSLSDTEVVISFGEHTATQVINVLPSTSIGNVEISNGQLLGNLKFLGYGMYGKKVDSFDAVVLYGQEKGHFTFQVGEGAEVYIGDDKQLVTGDGQYELGLNSSIDGTTTIVTLKSGTASKEYSFTCYSQKFSGMPTSVIDHFCIASQYTNGSGLGPYGINAAATLRGVNTMNETSGDADQGPKSLGNFGGYVTYYYDDSITDDPENPYGVDFIVYGNSYDGSNAFAEPGSVYVSEDGENWYVLAGSLHYDDNAIWPFHITYENKGYAAWTDSRGDNGKTDYSYPLNEYYPLFPWMPELESQITLSGVLLVPEAEVNEYGNTLPPYPHFGYADVGDEGESNEAFNPYLGVTLKGSRVYTGRTDGFDLKWAVDEKGLPVDVSDKEFHYIKIQTASNVVNGAIGEKSTEIHMVRTAAPATSSVGETAAPTSITVSGKKVTVPDGTSEIVNNVEVSGAFVVNIAAPEGANVYINGSRGISATFAKIPAHKILRIIVQEGEKEPWIGYLNLAEGEPNGNNQYTVVTFDPVGGTIDGARERTYMPEMPEDGKAFPIPVWTDREFLGWYDAAGKKYDRYTSDMPKELSLTARWQYILKPGESSNIKVSFRLIGATRSKGSIDLKNGDYKGSKYVTWIATKKYNMNQGNTVYDLFVTALAQARLESIGAEGNYVKTIKAPVSLGGYELSEFTNGRRSGWMYTVNGRHPGEGLQKWDLKDGDKVIWHYVNDYSYEVADWFDDPEYPALGDGTYFDKWLEAEDVDPSGLPIESGNGSSTILAPTATASNGVVIVTMSASDLAKAIEDAKTNDNTSIVIEPEISGTVKTISIELPKASVSSVASSTKADLTVKTPVGNLTIPNDVLAPIVSQASGNSITIRIDMMEKDALTAEQQKAIGTGMVYDISVLSGSAKITSFGDKAITISLPYTLKAGETAEGVTVWYLNDKGELEKMACKYDKTTKLATFTTNHLSKYLVGYTEAWKNPFTDVKSEAWYYNAVEYAVKNGLFNGTTATTFSPNSQMTRAMLVTVLYRMDQETKPVTTNGSAVTGGALSKPEANSFTDVKSGQWYTDAILWANEKGIVTGLGNGLFGINNDVTREQMATILYNYAKYKGYDTAKMAELKAFTDASAVSAWAQPAMKWTNAEGLVTGRTAATLAPKGNASRAEVATILKRFAEGAAK